MKRTDTDPCHNLIPELLDVGLIYVGEILNAVKHFPLQAEVLTDGKLLLNAWGLPLSLRAVTAKAHYIAEYGHGFTEHKLRAQNPLTFWSYLDQYTNADERLSRLNDIRLSSHMSEPNFCTICAEALRDGNAVGRQLDAFSFYDHRTNRLAVAPRRHFTKLTDIPGRDRRALEAFVTVEVGASLSIGVGVDVLPQFGDAGHAYYSIGSPG